MKQLIYLGSLCILLSLFVRCRKDYVYSNSISGTWELRLQTGGFSTTYAKRNGNLLKFSGSNYERYTNGTLSKTGTFALIPDTTVQQNVCLVLSNKEYKNRIVFDGVDNPRKTFVKITNNELDLYSGCFANDSCSGSIYAKQ